jgi:hypothetical protein
MKMNPGMAPGICILGIMTHCLNRRNRTSSRGIAVIGKEKDMCGTKNFTTLSRNGVKWGDMG